MVGTSSEEILAGFRRWAAEPGRELSGDLEDVAGDLSMALSSLSHLVGVSELSELKPDDLRELLLEFYPSLVMLADRSDAQRVVASLTDLTVFLADTGVVSAAAGRALASTLEEIGPQFADAVLDPSRWGPFVELLHKMHDDGVDTSDRAATDRWLANLLPPDDYITDGWDRLDLIELFAIPQVVAPVRLPGADELNTFAAGAPLIADLAALARDVRGEAVLRLDAVDPLLLSLAEQCGLIDEVGGGELAPGPYVTWIDDLTADEDFLPAWRELFAQVLDTTLRAADGAQDRERGRDLYLAGHGSAMAVALYRGPRNGVPVAELAESLKSAATSELEPGAAQRLWAEWTDAHGDPADLLLRQLERLRAVSLTAGAARLEPLGLAAVTERLVSAGVTVPKSPPAAEMEARDIVLVGMTAPRADLQAEVSAWAAQRGAGDAARELLDLAATDSAAARLVAVDAVSALGDRAEEAWRAALDRPQLAAYARRALTLLAGPAVSEELSCTTEDLAWFATDLLAPYLRHVAPETAVSFVPAELLTNAGDVSAGELLEVMARLRHPDAVAVLTMLGRRCRDKNTAKAARKAAYKAASARPRIPAQAQPARQQAAAAT